MQTLFEDSIHNRSGVEDMRIRSTLRYFTPILAMLGSNFFFAVSAIIGLDYAGIENSNVFLVYTVIVFIANGVLYIRTVNQNGGKLSIMDVSVFLLLGVIIISYLLPSLSTGRLNPMSTMFLRNFVAFTLPSIIAAICVSKMRAFSEIANLLELVMLTLSLSIIVKVILPYFQGQRFLTFAGAVYHQTGSYLAAFAFGLNLYFLLNGNHHERLAPFRTRFYRGVCLLLLVVQVLGFVLPGGRGGFVLGVTYFLFIVFSQVTTRSLRRLFRVLLLVLFLAAIIGASWPLLMQNNLFVSGFNRATQFISTGARIDWTGTSGRDSVYQNALHLIKESPVIGYGIFGMYEVTGNYPHNLFLEILLQGGVIFLVMAVSILFLFTRKLRHMIREDKSNAILTILFLYPIVMLMFSGTYLNTPQFWFVIVFVLVSEQSISEADCTQN